MMKKILLIIGLLGALSCDSGKEEGHKAYTKSYVIEYYSFSGIKAFWRDGSFIELRVIPNGKTYGVLSTDAAAKAKYEAKCALHGDNTYNQYFHYWTDIIPNQFQDRDFTGMEIVSGRDYDETHPAGTSLKDLFYFSSSSPAKYIARGYENPYDWDNFQSLPKYFFHYFNQVEHPIGCEPVYGMVAELEATDLILIGGIRRWDQNVLATLTPVKEPSLNKRHDITITLTDTDGNELTAHVVISF